MQLDPIVAAVDRLPLDAHERRAAAQLLRIQAAGERCADAGARAQARIAARRSDRRFLLRQARQESFHAVLFERVAQALDSNPDSASDETALASLERIRAALVDAAAKRRYTDAVVIQHVALEGLGHAVLELLDVELPAFGRRFGHVRRLILAQEDEHYAFGARVLAECAHDRETLPLVRRMLGEAEALLVAIAPQFSVLGGNVGEVIEPLRRGALASAGVAS